MKITRNPLSYKSKTPQNLQSTNVSITFGTPQNIQRDVALPSWTFIYPDTYSGTYKLHNGDEAWRTGERESSEASLLKAYH
jgi:hypothetical protein